MDMRAIAVRQAADWSGESADTVVLDYDHRYRRRVAMTGSKGVAFLLDLPAAAALHDGDGLVLEDGRLIKVVAAPEPLLEIRCSDPLHLARIAWHLGNRHLPTQMLENALRIRTDHVVADMAVQLGARVVEIEAPFDPEGGAYDRRQSGSYEHTHSHEHG